MITIISPAKSFDFQSSLDITKHSQPDFLEESEKLIKKMRSISKNELESLMKISSELASLNVNRYKEWSLPFNESNAKQALFAFDGNVYKAMNATEFDSGELDYAQNNFRIISGLYGLLRPLDLIQPYRLEMGTRLKYYSNNNLYQFWGDKITKALNLLLDKEQVLINLSSAEYYKSVVQAKLKSRVITPVFKDYKNGEYKMIMTFAKLGRGYLSNYIIKNKINNPELLKSFDLHGYAYSPKLSTENEWVFARG